MQIEPATAEFLARRSGATGFTVADLATPPVNIAYGSYYLRYLMDEFSEFGRILDARPRCSRSPPTTGVRRTFSAGSPTSGRGGRRSPIADIPFPQTRAYVEKVLQVQQEYRQKYARRARVPGLEP